MSHTVTIKVECNDTEALKKACDKVPGAEFLGNRHTKMFSGQAQGNAVQLKGWKYPVTFNAETGEASFDNYNGGWGKMEELDRLVQAYGVEKTKQEAYLHGLTFSEQDEVELANGDIQLTLHDHS